MILRSICIPKCSNGIRNDDEEWDDENQNSGDGWSNQWIVEDKYGCVGGNSTHRDYCYLAPTGKITSINSQNVIIIEFSKPMQMFNINSHQDCLTVTISGKLTTYKFTYEAYFISSTKIIFELYLIDQVMGYGMDQITIEFNKDYFISTERVSIYTDEVSTDIYQKDSAIDALGKGGTAISGGIATTIGIFIMSNVVL